MRKYQISLSNCDEICFETNINLIRVIEWLTREEYTKVYEYGNNGNPLMISRKHIVKITEVK